MPTFHRVLVANRGEIAVRIIRACREQGLGSVAVYSDADAHAPHVALADQAVRLGPAPAAESYLRADAMLAAARDTGADAIHPGYGFLSENAAFAAAVAAAGLTFIGPPAAVMAQLGSKTAARAIAERAGVPVVPGATPVDQSDAALAAAASQVGYPVLIKPSEGGGGIGMKAVSRPADLRAAAEQARREALAAFGDGTLYVERLIEAPRHIEVQILADQAGTVVHLFERECSLQRRHQKVVEESPSMAVTPALRARLGAAAVAVAAEAGYRNAGTVEFLLEGADSGTDGARFYFLEVNARLQVEHPVTELVTGVDLVQAQFAVAAGAPVPWPQAALTQRGHAIEVRVYAEDPTTGFLPQAGPLLLYREPQRPGVRVDAGVTEGDTVSVYYDPLLAKVIAAGETREAARRRLVAALLDFPILGVRTNVPYLLAILQHPRFIDGRLDVRFLETEAHALTAALAPRDGLSPVVRALAHAAAAPADPTGVARAVSDPWDRLRGFRG